MTAYIWIGDTGDWDVAGDWRPSSPAGPPTATDTATINATGPAYTVSIDTADVAKSLTESGASATVEDAGSLTLSKTFTLSAGIFILGQAGTLSGGTIKVTGGTFVCEGGTLSGVTYDGALDLSASGASIHLATGERRRRDWRGTINDTGAYSKLYFNLHTFNNATINLGSTSRGYCDLIDHGALTLGSNVIINESGHAAIDDYNSIVDRGNINQTESGGNLHIGGNSSFTNDGTITAASSGGALTIENTTFTNNGALDISQGETVTSDAATFTNAAAGVIAMSGDSTLNLLVGSNLGSITLASRSSLVLGENFTLGGSAGSIALARGSSLVLGENFTLADLGMLTNLGGAVYIQRTFDDTGGTLDGSNVLGQAVLDGGTVEGGTVTPSGLSISDSGGILSGVTYDGTLDLSGSSATVYLNSTVVNNAAGTGAGTINDSGDGSDLYLGDQTFNNATINLGNASGYSYLSAAGTVLTLGSGVTIEESGDAEIRDLGDGIVNQGKIRQTTSGSYLTVQGNGSLANSGAMTAGSSAGLLQIFNGGFANSGTLEVSNRDTVEIGPTVTGTGTDTISGASTLRFDSNVSSSTTVGAQNISFLGGGTLDLFKPAGFYGEVSGFAAGDTVELSGSWAFSGISEAGGLTTLTLASGATTHAFDFVGDYAQGDFKITSGPTSTITHT